MRWSSLAVLLCASFAFAQSPQMLVNGENSQAILLERADISAVISGCLAKTSITLTFRNQTNQILEGD